MSLYHILLSREAVYNTIDRRSGKPYRLYSWLYPSLTDQASLGRLTSQTMSHNVTFRRVRAITVALEKQYYIFCVCFCSLKYPACNANAPYCHLWPDWLYSICPHYLINGTIFGEKITKPKMYIIY